MNEGQLPTFAEDQVYLLKGRTLNKIIQSIIKEIIVDGVSVTKPGPNKAKINFTFKDVEDCDGNTYGVATRPAQDAEEGE